MAPGHHPALFSCSADGIFKDRVRSPEDWWVPGPGLGASFYLGRSKEHQESSQRPSPSSGKVRPFDATGGKAPWQQEQRHALAGRGFGPPTRANCLRRLRETGLWDRHLRPVAAGDLEEACEPGVGSASIGGSTAYSASEGPQGRSSSSPAAAAMPSSPSVGQVAVPAGRLTTPPSCLGSKQQRRRKPVDFTISEEESDAVADPALIDFSEEPDDPRCRVPAHRIGDAPLDKPAGPPPGASSPQEASLRSTGLAASQVSQRRTGQRSVPGRGGPERGARHAAPRARKGGMLCSSHSAPTLQLAVSRWPVQAGGTPGQAAPSGQSVGEDAAASGASAAHAGRGHHRQSARTSAWASRCPPAPSQDGQTSSHRANSAEGVVLSDMA
eukprot:TRINITY_DN25495_c0_g1_i1.p1 TRINITY_DN25495_c0_g1~~TRINITY_DN25495_c0_g1_i1.p1  ORF type:complete len:384 (+),score=46.39 TRINITY_DN25495_c0_g1_i1:119-1270(+)